MPRVPRGAASVQEQRPKEGQRTTNERRTNNEEQNEDGRTKNGGKFKEQIPEVLPTLMRTNARGAPCHAQSFACATSGWLGKCGLRDTPLTKCVTGASTVHYVSCQPGDVLLTDYLCDRSACCMIGALAVYFRSWEKYL